MLNRRQLRIKVLQALYAYHYAPEQSVVIACKNLISTTRSSYTLYLILLQALLEIQERELLLMSNRESDPHGIKSPLERLQLIQWLQKDPDFNRLKKIHKTSWANHREVIDKVFHKLKTKKEYLIFSGKESGEAMNEKDFTLWLISDGVLTEDILVSAIDDINVFYASSFDNAVDMIYKSLKASFLSPVPEFKLLDLYKDQPEDEEFISELFKLSISKSDYLDKLIAEKTDNWELDRIAVMDNILLKMALTEIMNFSNIPIKVSINEYIELSKNFSTPKSRIFINGVLDKIMNELKTKGEIVKTGRGLIE